jgi:hypothetical protein
MSISGDEVLAHVRGDIERWLSADGNDVPQHELAAAVERMLPMVLAWNLANAMTCACLAEPYYDPAFIDRAKSQLWNWQ